jgi:hypothetical protein
MEDLEQPVVDSDAQEGEDAGVASGEQDFELDSDELDNEQSDDQDDELEEDLDGVKVRGKKEAIERLKAERLMQADYTRKTQEAAELRKAAEAQQQSLQAQRQFESQNLDILADMRAIDRELANLGQVNLSQLSDQDPGQAQKVMVRLQQLQTLRGQAESAISQRYQQFSQWQQQQAARQLEEGHRVLQREIPGWGPEIANKLRSYALANGFTEQEVENERRPAIIRALWRDYQMSEAKKSATKRSPQVQQAPVTRVSAASKAKAVVDPDKLSPDQWLKWRNSQVKKR